jgi:pimeloyl-ACP methyl ester carboxylesterase
MRKNLKWTIPLILVILIAAVYLWPVTGASFEKNYARVDTATTVSLKNFRAQHPAKSLNVNGVTWEYAGFGQGQEAIVFLHGTTGAYDIWWQQMQELQDRYHVVSVTYPAVNTLQKLDEGVMAVMDAEKVSQAHIVGTSLGGYLAQYLVAKHPERVLSAVFSNTFPNNDILAEKNKAIGTALPFLPECLVMAILRDSFVKVIYPTSGNNEVTLAFLTEMASGRMSKAQVYGRYLCDVEPITNPNVAALKFPTLIIEADNDPLVEKSLREQLKAAYPAVPVRTLSSGHFPYLNRSTGFTSIIADFITANSSSVKK